MITLRQILFVAVAAMLSLGQESVGRAEEKADFKQVKQMLKPQVVWSKSPSAKDVGALWKAGCGWQAGQAMLFWTQSFDLQIARAPRKDSDKRTQVRFVGPAGMKIAWNPAQPDGNKGFAGHTLEAPGRYNFPQGASYRLKLSDIPNRPGVELYPTLEVASGNNKTLAFLAHNAVPLRFTDEDFDQVASGALVVKVVWLPDPKLQAQDAKGLSEVVSTQLEPGLNPITEAQRQGSILLVLRLGNIDLEAPRTPPLALPTPKGNVKPKDSPEMPKNK